MLTSFSLVLGNVFEQVHLVLYTLLRMLCASIFLSFLVLKYLNCSVIGLNSALFKVIFEVLNVLEVMNRG